MSPAKVFLSIARGDAEAHTIKRKAHQDVADWLIKNGQTYGLPDSIGSLDEVQRETLQSLYEGENSLVVGKLVFELSDKANFAKFTQNFETLCTGAQGHGVNKKGFSYRGTPIHRYAPGFVLQGGDVTRFDGSGGESVFGGSMTDPKPPHSKHDYGTLSMASGSAKNSSTSQFFICLSKAGSPEATKKLDGKYYVFGNLVDGTETLRKLEEELDQRRKELGLKGDAPGMKVWVEDCGLWP